VWGGGVKRCPPGGAEANSWLCRTMVAMVAKHNPFSRTAPRGSSPRMDDARGELRMLRRGAAKLEYRLALPPPNGSAPRPLPTHLSLALPVLRCLWRHHGSRRHSPPYYSAFDHAQPFTAHPHNTLQFNPLHLPCGLDRTSCMPRQAAPIPLCPTACFAVCRGTTTC
jgi:hypothetical protein